MVRKGEWLAIHVGVAIKTTPEQWISEQGLVPDKLMQQLIHQEGIKLQGNKLRLRLFPHEFETRFLPEWRELDLLYEDDFCLVVNKPAGLLVHPTHPGQSGTLANAIAAYYEETGQCCKVRHIHRLDEFTSGPILYAKNELSQINLDEQMRNKSIVRGYIALIDGIIEPRNGIINEAIGKDRHHPNRRRVSPHGDAAVTHYEVIEVYDDCCCLRIRLETGRTHQIRVHFSHLRHSLLGDALYGGSVKRIRRQALHGESLLFRHPFTFELIEVDVPCPVDLQVVMDELRMEATRKM